MGFENMELIQEGIETLGFPIFIVIVLIALICYFGKQYLAQVNKREEKLLLQLEKSDQRLDNFSDTMNRFNETLVRIDTRLETVEKAILK